MTPPTARKAKATLGMLIDGPIPIYTREAQALQQIIAAENARRAQEGLGTKFSARPLPQPGEGCRERWVVHHSYANGVPISSTEAAVAFGGQIAAMHPKFRWELYDMEERDRRLKRLRAEREGKPLEEMPAAPRPERRVTKSRPGHRPRALRFFMGSRKTRNPWSLAGQMK